MITPVQRQAFEKVAGPFGKSVAEGLVRNVQHAIIGMPGTEVPQRAATARLVADALETWAEEGAE